MFQLQTHLNGAANLEVRNFAFQVLGVAPTGNWTGRFYFDSALAAPRWWDGTAFTNRATDSALLGGQSSAFHLGRANHTGTQTAATISDFDAQVRTSRLDQMAAPTAAVTLNAQRLTNLAAPTADSDAATKAYVDAARSGLDVKASVRAASTANVAGTYTAAGGTSGRGQLTAMPNAVDGVTLAANDRVLLKDQTTGAQNGIWVVTTLGTGADGVWDRASDFDADAEVTSGAFSFVEEGTTNDNTGWVLTTNNPITVGGASGTALAFAQFSGAGSITAGAGLTKTGTTIDAVAGSAPASGGPGGGLVVTPDSIVVDTNVVARRGASNLTGAGTSFVVAHGLGHADLAVSVRLVATGRIEYPEVVVDATNITVTFVNAPGTDTYRVAWTG